jgi:2-hydroxyglutarate dehydrogenase
VYDVAVVGGGIVGLATGRELLIRRPGLRLAIVEKEAALASHQSSRNSGVIHSGIYYRPGTLRARLCREGAKALRSYCDAQSIAWRTTGKLIVAVDERELPALDALHQRGIENGVDGLQLLDEAAIREREPNCVARKAIFVPETAVVDYGEVAASFAREIVAAGAEIICNAAVVDARRSDNEVVLETVSDEYAAKMVVSCAGLGADVVARALGGSLFPRVEPVRGEFLALKPERRNLVNGCIYPVPNAKLPFLGAHVTPRIDGSVWLGPSDSAQKDVLATVQRYLPSLREEDTQPGGFGIRALAIDEHDAFVDDFIFESSERVVHVRSAPSPAATAALAIARHVADML